MTTSLKRQSDAVVSGILKAYKIDNLQLEIDLSSSLYRLFSEGGRDPKKWVDLREDILAPFRVGLEEENEIIEMERRITGALGFNIDGRSSFTQMVRYVIRMEKENGQTIEDFGKWVKENPYEAPKPFQIAKEPDLLMRNWPLAFQKPELKAERPEHATFTGGEDVRTANPFRKPSILRRPSSVD